MRDTHRKVPDGGRSSALALLRRLRGRQRHHAGSVARRGYSVRANPSSRFTLVYGNRTMARTMFLEDTLALKNRFTWERFSVYFVMSREPQHTALLNGRIDAAKIEALSREIVDIAGADEYFVCGPGGMVGGGARRRQALERYRTDTRRAFRRRPLRARVRRARVRRGRVRRGRRSRRALPPIGRCRRRGAGDDIRPHGRPAPQLSPCRRAMRPCSRPRSAQDWTCRSRAAPAFARPAAPRSWAATAVMSHNIALEPWETHAGFRAVLPGAAHDADARVEL